MANFYGNDFENEELFEETYHSRYMEPGLHRRYEIDQKHINRKLRNIKAMNGSLSDPVPMYNNRNSYRKNKITFHSRQDRLRKKLYPSLQTEREKLYEKLDLRDYYSA